MATKICLTKSVKHAFAGIVYCVRRERNMRIHLFAACVAFALAWRLNLDKQELVMLCLTVAGVLTAEIFNTAIEALVDLVSPEFHPLAKVAKDAAAGSVLLAALASLVVGYLLFVPKLLG